MAPKKSSAIIPAGSSTSRFRSAEHATYYRKLLEEKITVSRTLDESRLKKFKVAHYFQTSSLLQLLRLEFPFNRDFVYEMYANMEIPFSRACIRSRVLGRDVELTREDFHERLGLSMSGHSIHATVTDGGFDWAALNKEIRGVPYDAHVGVLEGLTRDARIVQHILRTAVYPKVGDKTAITPTLSVSTYFILTGKEFDATDAVIRYIEDTMAVRLAHVKRKKNLVLGHVLSYLVFSKYAARSPRPCDAPPVFFSDASFHILFGKKKIGDAPTAAGVDPEEEATEYAHPEAPRPMFRGESSTSHETSFDFTSFQTYVDSRFDRMDSRFDHLDSTQSEILGQLAWIRSRLEGPTDHPTEEDAD